MKKLEDCLSEDKYISVCCVITEKKLSELDENFIYPFINKRKQSFIDSNAETYLSCIEKYFNRCRGENEIIFYTTYSYADINKKAINFDTIFNPTIPYEFEPIKVSIKHILFEGKLPTDFLEHGHKHICIFSVDGNKIKLLDGLPKDDWNTNKWLGLCNSNDWDNIKLELIKRDVSK